MVVTPVLAMSGFCLTSKARLLNVPVKLKSVIWELNVPSGVESERPKNVKSTTPDTDKDPRAAPGLPPLFWKTRAENTAVVDTNSFPADRLSDVVSNPATFAFTRQTGVIQTSG